MVDCVKIITWMLQYVWNKIKVKLRHAVKNGTYFVIVMKIQNNNNNHNNNNRRSRRNSRRSTYNGNDQYQDTDYGLDVDRLASSSSRKWCISSKEWETGSVIVALQLN